MTLSLRVLTPLVLLGLGACAFAPRMEGKRLTLENTAGRGERVNLRGELESWRWAPDGIHLVRGKGKEAAWFDASGTQKVETPAQAEDPDSKVPFPVSLLPSAESDPSYKLLGSGADGSLKLCQQSGELFLLSESNGAAQFKRLTKASNPALELAQLSPDGERVAFVQGNNLILLDCVSGERRALTSDGSVNTFNGKLDWVYQEEIYGRGKFNAFWWSPDSAHIAFLKLDETEVHQFTVVDHIEEGSFRVKGELTKYPKSGDPNPTVQLGIADAYAPSDVRFVDLSEHQASEPLVMRVLWNPSGERLLYVLQDRIQTWMEFNAVNPVTAAQVNLIKENSSSWVNRPSPPYWLVDGSFLWLSESSGMRHIYHHSADGSLLAQLTEGDWAVGSISHVDDAGRIWFSSTKDGAINQNAYRINLDGSGLTRLTQGAGRHRLSFNADRSAFLDHSSSLSNPASVKLYSGAGKLKAELASSNMGAYASYATSAWELHEVLARDGFVLDVSLLKPVDFDPRASYPVWVPTYSGPNAPSVRNAWNSSNWYQFLAQNGVVVMQVNVRSASGKGLRSTATCYKQLGIQELSDLQDAVAWLTAKPYADAARVGITGHSYGGFMTAFALTHSETFALGVASSGVYDWGMYDSIYTERYMQTPALNPEGYAATSVIAAAANLKGHLLITHGVMDDNVHFQNAVQLVFALQKAEKPFEFMLYPQQRHGIRHPALRWKARQLEWDAIQRILKP